MARHGGVHRTVAQSAILAGVIGRDLAKGEGAARIEHDRLATVIGGGQRERWERWVQRDMVPVSAALQAQLDAWRGVEAEAKQAKRGVVCRQPGLGGGLQHLLARFGMAQQSGQMGLDKARIRGRVQERLLFQYARQERGIGFHRPDLHASAGLGQTLGGDGAARRVGDEFGDQRVVKAGDLVALLHGAVDPHALAGEVKMLQPTGRWQEAGIWSLGVEPGLDGMAGEGDLLLAQWQGFTGGDAELPLHQILPCHGLGDRMLHLQPGVHLHEPDFVRAQAGAGVGNELDRSGPLVIHRPSGLHRGGAERGANLVAQAGGRGFLDHLLVAALERAVALEQMHDIAMGIAEDLDLDMARACDIDLQQDAVIAEGGLRLAAAGGQSGGEILRAVHPAHALAPASGDGLDQQRVADALGLGGQAGVGLILSQIAGRGRHTGFHHQRLGGVLQPHGADGGRAWPDPDQPGGENGFGERCVLGEEAVTGMDGLRPAGVRGGEEFLRHQITLLRRGGADGDGLVGLGHEQSGGVNGGMDRDGADAEAACGADDAAGDLATVGDEKG